jgi:hypothetical protein
MRRKNTDFNNGKSTLPARADAVPPRRISSCAISPHSAFGSIWSSHSETGGHGPPRRARFCRPAASDDDLLPDVMLHRTSRRPAAADPPPTRRRRPAADALGLGGLVGRGRRVRVGPPGQGGGRQSSSNLAQGTCRDLGRRLEPSSSGANNQFHQLRIALTTAEQARAGIDWWTVPFPSQESGDPIAPF